MKSQKKNIFENKNKDNLKFLKVLQNNYNFQGIVISKSVSISILYDS